MALRLVAGPANAGKVALLLERYVDELQQEPFLIVPGRPDVERVERELTRRQGALLGGAIGTFDDVFERVARAGPGGRPVVGDAVRALLVRRAIRRTDLDGLGGSARSGGFADALGVALAELEAGLLDPADVEGELAALYAAYR